MLSRQQIDKINSDKGLLTAVNKLLEEHSKKNPMILTPDDLPGVWDVYVEGVKVDGVFYVDLEKRMVRVYTKPVQIVNGEAKYVEMYGKIRLQKRLHFEGTCNEAPSLS